MQENPGGSKLPGKPAEKLLHLQKEAAGCSLCELRKTCNQVVFGEGNFSTRLLLVGEGPGAEEDRLGRPFVGRAGQLLDRILTAAEIKREDVYITNVVKCRPPANRLPFQPEVDACYPYLKAQIELIKPEIVLCLGALATRTLYDKNAAITRVRGQWKEKDGRRILATFHPAALLRDPSKKKPAWEDFKMIMAVYHKTQKEVADE